MTDTPPSTSEAQCPHAGDCGGCRTQHLPYDQQLADKAEVLQELFKGMWSAPVEVDPSPKLWHYRNKVELNFDRKMYEERPPADFVRETVIGFKRLGMWYWTLDNEDCLIGPDGIKDLLPAVRQWYRENDLKARFQKTREGALRYLVLRQASRGGQRMAILITNGEPVPTDSFTTMVQKAWQADSVYLAIHRGDADVAQADELIHLAGPESIREVMHIPDKDGVRELAFQISPFAFFQTNSLGAEVLYGHLRRWVAAIKPPLLYDLYGGAGCIALACADLVPQIISVESVVEATNDGLINIGLNDANNITFHTQDVRRYLTGLRMSEETFDARSTVIVDPPRSGMHPKALTHLAGLGPQHILYVSCNPKILARELPVLLQKYELKQLRAVDLFPHTPHVEALAWLTRRES